ncbi:hypothetical protein PTSG_02906 [Salpingoeca rosetta]|uniref:NYN domain-containing protein n=1 Tax=Salpingoeca rosetta (strain ATCC 50818 / BSB-021) TaxID=946362 RepID=F2U3P1_SALR5|nr:uncharacterized protein PTSG_02906 [Salpingoeca rosetta]EGD82235.1 hypothetical protein PTSG_02906 [Salpingoeca rosetta]|eukprot:XP_004996418.1 hypothetical protein PTSG_02906 [Salpingoeca rosetta]
MEEPKGEKALLLVDGTCYFAPLERDRLSVRAAPKWLERLSEKIADRWSLSIARIHLFDAVMDSSLHDFPSHRKADKSRKSLLRNMQQAHIAVHFRYLKPFRTNCEDVNCRYKSAAIEVPVGAGVDVAITTFALADMPTDVKTVVLFVTDPDYAPLIRALKGKGTRVLVVTDSDAALDPALRDALDEHNPTPFKDCVSFLNVHKQRCFCWF